MLPIKEQSDYEALIAGAELIEKDGHGIKVLRLPDGRMLKFFRRKRLFSSQLWNGYALRFKQNADQLRQRGIATIEVESVFQIPHLDRQAVLYPAIPGTTLRQWLIEHPGKPAQEQIRAFGRFVATLHQKGVLFRSLHLGNVLVTNDDALALIDISDMSFRRTGPLSTWQRVRNLPHIGRYTDDRHLMLQPDATAFIDAYLDAAELSTGGEKRFRENFTRLFAAPE